MLRRNFFKVVGAALASLVLPVPKVAALESLLEASSKVPLRGRPVIWSTCSTPTGGILNPLIQSMLRDLGRDKIQKIAERMQDYGPIGRRHHE